MKLEFSGIERRLDALSERLARLEPLKARARAEFDADPHLRDIVKRNLEVAAQCVIGIAHRIIALERAEKPRDYYEVILRLGELGVLPSAFAHELSPLAGFRNLQNLDDLVRFSELIGLWPGQRAGRAGQG